MISRIFIKNSSRFGELELKFKKGLTVFTGSSGAGKSVFMNHILACFAFKEVDATLVESELDFAFDLEDYGILEEENYIFKVLYDKNRRFFINSQAISKKNIMQISQQYLKYLSISSLEELQSQNILELLDKIVSKNDKNFPLFLKEYKKKFKAYKKTLTSLQQIQEEEKRVEDKKEFLSFEIEKLKKANIKIGEYEELLENKKRLSQKDKLNELWLKAEKIFDFEKAVIDALNMSNINSSFFEDALNELRIKRESVNFDDLNELDIEKILDRIELLSSLIKKYESEEQALKILEEKEVQLKRYENLSFEKEELEKDLAKSEEDLQKDSEVLTEKRRRALAIFEEYLNSYLQKLYMSACKVELKEEKMSENGKDEVFISFENITLQKLSSGEINRLRLAFLALYAKISNFGKGVIFLDEIDANLSGKEVTSIAEVIKELAKFYQIFAISHHPQLSSRADNHFLIEKDGAKSFIREIFDDERAVELARMVSGEDLSDEALNFAKKILKN